MIQWSVLHLKHVFKAITVLRKVTFQHKRFGWPQKCAQKTKSAWLRLWNTYTVIYSLILLVVYRKRAPSHQNSVENGKISANNPAGDKNPTESDVARTANIDSNREERALWTLKSQWTRRVPVLLFPMPSESLSQQQQRRRGGVGRLAGVTSVVINKKIAKPPGECFLTCGTRELTQKPSSYWV